MKDKIKEQISAFIDNEAYDSDIIEQTKHNDELRATMTRYSLIGDVLNNRYTVDSHTLASRVHNSLDDEATLIAPKQWIKAPKIMKQVAGLAVAATVAAVAILVVGDYSPSKITETTIAVGPITDKPILMTSEVQSKLNGYLVSHTEYSASSRMKGMLPYSRIASFAPGQYVTSPSNSSLGAASRAAASLEE